MKKAIQILIIISTLCLSGFSQTKKENIEKLFEVMQIDKMNAKVYDAMLPMMNKYLIKTVPDSLRTSEYESFMKEGMEKLMIENKKLGKDFRENEMIGIYDKNFSDTEIKDLILFYNSLTGRKLSEKQSVIQQETSEILMTKYLPKYRESMTILMKEIYEKTKKKE